MFQHGIEKRQQTVAVSISNLAQRFLNGNIVSVGEKISILQQSMELISENRDDHQVTVEQALEHLWIVVSLPALEDELYDVLLSKFGSKCCITAVVSVLKALQQEKKGENPTVTLDLTLSLLHRATGRREDSFWRVSKEEEEFYPERWISLLLALPSLIANACQTIDYKAFPSWASPDRFATRLVDGALEEVLQKNKGLLICRTLVTVLCRRSGGADAVALGIQKAYIRHAAAKCSFTTCILLKSLLPKNFSLVARSLIRLILSNQASEVQVGMSRYSDPWLDSTVRAVACGGENGDHAEALVQLMILGTTSTTTVGKDSLVFCFVVASLLTAMPDRYDKSLPPDDQASSDPDEPLRTHLMNVASIWAPELFVLQTEQSVQRHLTNFLRSGLQLLTQKEDSTSELVLGLLEGVSPRLSSTNPEIRQDGMIVAELIAWMLGEELRFDELEVIREWTGETSPDCFTMSNDLVVLAKQKDDGQGPTKDSFGTADDNSINDSSWGSADELDQYDVSDDEEDLRETPKPLYLTECLDLLRTPESDENAASRHETALQEVSRLVQSRPADLPNVASSLAFELLRMENKFDTDGFDDYVSTSLCVLASEEPLSVGKMLIAELFQDLSLGDRMTALQALCEGAADMAGHSHSSSKPKLLGKVNASLRDDESSSSTEVSSITLAGGLLRQVASRRKGRTKPFTAPETSVNKFGIVAPYWFYELLGQFLENKEKVLLWRGTIGATFLAGVFQTLATFVECSHNTNGTHLLARDLIQLTWAFRDADISEVRAAVLFAVATSLNYLPQHDALLLITDDSSTGLGRHLPVIAAQDPDDTCRSLARLVCEQVTSLVQ